MDKGHESVWRASKFNHQMIFTDNIVDHCPTELQTDPELEGLQLEEQKRQEEENKKLQEMDESERMEYLRRKQQEEGGRRANEERGGGRHVGCRGGEAASGAARQLTSFGCVLTFDPGSTSPCCCDGRKYAIVAR
ncbi:hypothetical protein INR49_026998 [Caranx melampygus]|nr:hypothetical protein INR49_026998 [Caranx melampygus]